MSPYIVNAQIKFNAASANVGPAINSIKRQLGAGGVTMPVTLQIKSSSAQALAKQNAQFKSLALSIQNISKAANQTATAFKHMQAALNNINHTISQGNQATQQITRNNRGINSTGQAINNVGKAARASNRYMVGFAESVGISARRFASFGLAAGVIATVSYNMRNAIRSALEFDREMVRLQQVSQGATAGIDGVVKTITRLGVKLGISSEDMSKTAVTLRQAGLSARETSKALEILGKTTLSPTFENLSSTTEGLIGLFGQFGHNINDLEKDFDAISRVSADFAVESTDLIEAVKRTGGAFRQAGGDVNQLLAMFTTIRSTTRESAASIATGLRTILARLQDPAIAKKLHEVGVEVYDLKGKFVGPMEAINRLGEALRNLPAGDIRASAIIKDIGGLRQLSRVIPLIYNPETTQSALQSARNSMGTLQKDSETAQKALLVQLSRVKEGFLDLFRVIAEDTSVRKTLGFIISAVETLTGLMRELKPLVPVFLAFTSAKVISSAVSGFSKFKKGFFAPVSGYAEGGWVRGGTPGKDSVPAMLMPGEYVVPAKQAKAMARGGIIPRYMHWERGRLAQILRGSHGREIYQHLRGSTYLGSGVEALAFKSPTGNVLRLGSYRTQRPVDDLTLQSLNSKIIGSHLLEELPFATTLARSNLSDSRRSRILRAFKSRLDKRGLTAWDLSESNIGLHNNKVKAIDPDVYQAKLKKFDNLNIQTPIKTPSDDIFASILGGDRVGRSFGQLKKFADGGEVDAFYLPASSLDKDIVTAEHIGYKNIARVYKMFPTGRINRMMRKYGAGRGLHLLTMQAAHNRKMRNPFSPGVEYYKPQNYLRHLRRLHKDVLRDTINEDKLTQHNIYPSDFALKNARSLINLRKQQRSETGYMPVMGGDETIVKQYAGFARGGLISRDKFDARRQVGFNLKLLDKNHRREVYKILKNTNHIGSGYFASAFLSNKGTVYRFGAKENRINHPLMLQPISRKEYNNIMLEELPYVLPLDKNNNFSQKRIDKVLAAFKSRVSKKGLLDKDLEPKNVGILNNKVVAFDPGAIGDIDDEMDNQKRKYFLLKKLGFADGGVVPWVSSPSKMHKGTDTVPAILTPNEFVIRKDAARKIGYNKLHYMNETGKLPGYMHGGTVGKDLTMDVLKEYLKHIGLDIDPKQFINKVVFDPKLKDSGVRGQFRPGRKPSEHRIAIGPDANIGTLLHEFGHALDFTKGKYQSDDLNHPHSQVAAHYAVIPGTEKKSLYGNGGLGQYQPHEQNREGFANAFASWALSQGLTPKEAQTHFQHFAQERKGKAAQKSLNMTGRYVRKMFGGAGNKPPRKPPAPPAAPSPSPPPSGPSPIKPDPNFVPFNPYNNPVPPTFGRKKEGFVGQPPIIKESQQPVAGVIDLGNGTAAAMAGPPPPNKPPTRKRIIQTGKPINSRLDLSPALGSGLQNPKPTLRDINPEHLSFPGMTRENLKNLFAMGGTDQGGRLVPGYKTGLFSQIMRMPPVENPPFRPPVKSRATWQRNAQAKLLRSQRRNQQENLRLAMKDLMSGKDLSTRHNAKTIGTLNPEIPKQHFGFVEIKKDRELQARFISSIKQVDDSLTKKLFPTLSQWLTGTTKGANGIKTKSGGLLGKLKGLKGSGIGQGALFAASMFAQPAIESVLGTTKEPGKFGTTGAKVGSVVGGALSGAAGGAAIGSFFGPVGTAVGALGGAALGAAGSLKEMAEEVKQIRLGELEDALNNLKVNGQGNLTTSSKINLSTQLSKSLAAGVSSQDTYSNRFSREFGTVNDVLNADYSPSNILKNTLGGNLADFTKSMFTKGKNVLTEEYKPTGKYSDLQTLSDEEKELFSGKMKSLFEAKIKESPGKSYGNIKKEIGSFKVGDREYGAGEILNLNHKYLEEIQQLVAFASKQKALQEKMNALVGQANQSFEITVKELESFSDSLQKAGEQYSLRSHYTEMSSAPLRGQLMAAPSNVTIGNLGGEGTVAGDIHAFSKKGGGYDQARKQLLDIVQSVGKEKLTDITEEESAAGVDTRIGAKAGSMFRQSGAGGKYNEGIAQHAESILSTMPKLHETLQNQGAGAVVDSILGKFNAVKETGRNSDQELQRTYQMEQQRQVDLLNRGYENRQQRSGLALEQGNLQQNRAYRYSLLNPDKYAVAGNRLIGQEEGTANVSLAVQKEAFNKSQSQFVNPSFSAEKIQSLYKEAEQRMQSTVAKRESARTSGDSIVNIRKFDQEILKTQDEMRNYAAALKNLADNTGVLEASQRKYQVAVDQYTADYESRKKDADVLTFGSRDEKMQLAMKENITQQSLSLNQEQFASLPDQIKKIVYERLNETQGMQRSIQRYDQYGRSRGSFQVTGEQALQYFRSPYLNQLTRGNNQQLRDRAVKASLNLQNAEDQQMAAKQGLLGLNEKNTAQQAVQGEDNFQKYLAGINQSIAQQMQATQKFLEGSAELTKALNSFPSRITVERQGKIEVIINGAALAQNLKNDVERGIMEEVIGKLQDMIKKEMKNQPAR